MEEKGLKMIGFSTHQKTGEKIQVPPGYYTVQTLDKDGNIKVEFEKVPTNEEMDDEMEKFNEFWKAQREKIAKGEKPTYYKDDTD
ncbi:hypothetical protein CAEBREN_20773 [Caenorhabditis brenneri]|uniref:Uncharacterized protein n=1 Tax=Caenorhabditis brenneri TaxID=135651 RepID=G0N2Z1_CAEBE|nr:hypothetical protein CAEBREN_20773 [Caenorhabditis brenneri]